MVSWVKQYADLGHPGGLQTQVPSGWLQPQMSPGAGCHLLSPQDLILLLLCSTQTQRFSHELVGGQKDYGILPAWAIPFLSPLQTS